MNKAIIGIVGPSGSGKSTSLRNLPRDRTVIIDLERKGFPFRKNFPNTYPAANSGEFDIALEKALSQAKSEKIDVIVIESFTKYCESVLTLCQRSFKGYDIWNGYNKMIRIMLDKIKNKNAVVMLTAIDEIVRVATATGEEYNTRRIKVSGKQQEGCIEKEFLMVLYTEARRNGDKIDYVFQTNTDGISSAKTPIDMFSKTYIPNDINTVLEEAKKYYI